MNQVLSPSPLHLIENDPLYGIEEEAQRLLLLGQTELIKRNLLAGCELFEQACSLKPNNPYLYFQQGLSLFEFGAEENEEKVLLTANKKFKIATSLLPEYFQAWFLWGVTLAYLGKTQEKYHYFLEAEKKLSKAKQLSEGKALSTLADLYREYGEVKTAIAERSKEAHDWYLAMEYLERSSQYHYQAEPDFWNLLGKASLALSKQVNDIRLCVKAIHNFKHAISHESSNYEGWKNLSMAMSLLYEHTHDEDHFSQANDCFATCVQIHPLADDMWLAWAGFLLKSARGTCDAKRLQAAIDKCFKAKAIDLSNISVDLCLGEALSFMGELTEQLEPLYEGQNKLQEASEKKPEDPLVWKALGESFISMGKYFEEPDYVYQAIESFQKGLSINRTCHELWFSIAQAYTLAGMMLGDTSSLEKAEGFYRKAINLYPKSSNYHFSYAYCLAKLGELTRDEHFLDSSLQEFEKVLYIQKNALYLHPDWLFEYAKTLDLYGEFFEEECHYQKAIEIFSHILMVDPDFPQIHYHAALAYMHLGELTGEIESFYKALHYFKLAAKHEEENDQILVELAITLINIAQYSNDSLEIDLCYKDAESKLIQAIKAGNLQAYYQIACLFSLLRETEKSLAFLFKTESFQALPAIEDLLEDEWLEHVRYSEGFQNFLHYLENKSRQHEEL